jgi:hypothetical protein
MANQFKYEDKSAGQPEMVNIFNQVKEIMRPFAVKNYIVNADKPGYYEIYYGKEAEVAGRKFPELMLAALLIQKGYVALHFFPLYIEQALKEKLSPELLQSLNGKSCFNLKKNDPELMEQIRQAFNTAVDFYRSKGWS